VAEHDFALVTVGETLLLEPDGGSAGLGLLQGDVQGGVVVPLPRLPRHTNAGFLTDADDVTADVVIRLVLRTLFEGEASVAEPDAQALAEEEGPNGVEWSVNGVTDPHIPASVLGRSIRVVHVTDYIGYVRQSIPTGQWFTSRDGTPWWFDSGSVALDFAYTGGFDAKWESLLEPANLTDWLHGRFPEVDGEISERQLVDAKRMRESLARMATAASRAEPAMPNDVDVINLFAATPDIPPPALAGGSRQAGRTTAKPDQALAAMAREAVDLFSQSLDRIRCCAAADCGLIFFDESRSNNRRWCSMGRCGNRSKVRAHRSRTGAPAL
jgi:predicted RNA-binding Zn ribbon-like protein